MSREVKFHPSPVEIVKQLVRSGYEAYIVGGAVRDLLLNHQPKDYDITTIATPEEVRKVFGRRRCRIIGRRFRLALVFADGEQYEVSTFRKEPTAKERSTQIDDDGVMIWRDNVYGTLDDDFHRRDFTVNALYCDVAGDGSIIDRTGGRRDIQNRIVRCIGEPTRRFQEDPIRMLRALKLVGQHNFTLTPEVESALCANAESIIKTSVARRFEELLKILFTDKSQPILKACQKYGLLQYFWSGLSSVWDTQGGSLIQDMLRLHDECIAEDIDFFHSRALALATVCLPYALSSMAGMEDSAGDRKNIRNDLCEDAIRSLFAGYIIPRDVFEESRDLILHVSYFASNITKRTREYLIHSNLYPQSYELFRILTMATGWSVKEFNDLPFPEEVDSCEVPSPPSEPKRRRKKAVKTCESPAEPS